MVTIKEKIGKELIKCAIINICCLNLTYTIVVRGLYESSKI